MDIKQIPVNLDISSFKTASPVKPQSRQEKDDAELKKACRDFESMLVSQMLREMRNSVPKTDFFGSSEKEKMFQDMLDQEVCKNLSATGKMGLADLIYKQLTDNKKPLKF